MNDNHQLSTAPTAMPMNTGLAIFDSGQFEHLYRVADALASSSLIPDALRGKTPEETRSNCLLVTEQSHRWGLSPFAVAQCASVIRGRLMWEGKLVHAVIQVQSGINLQYDISGEGESMKVIVSGTLPGEDKPRTVEGTVKAWKTTGDGSPWKSPDNYARQLRYRGAREWARAHNPAVMLGVVTEDEELPPMRDVTPKSGGVRETHINPFENMQAEALPDSSMTATEMASPVTTAINPLDKSVTAAEAAVPEAPKAESEKEKAKREKKERIVCDAKFRSLTPKESKGKNWWVVGILIKGQYREVTTFSTTMATDLGWLKENDNIEITVVPSADGKSNQLEAFKTIKPEGSLV